MATKQFYATRDMKNPSSYGTRMLKAGDPVELDGPKARLYLALKAVTAEKPKRGGSTMIAHEPQVRSAPTPAAAPKPAAKPARKRKAAAKKK